VADGLFNVMVLYPEGIKIVPASSLFHDVPLSGGLEKSREYEVLLTVNLKGSSGPVLNNAWTWYSAPFSR
jgi:hypothetical protein